MENPTPQKRGPGRPRKDAAQSLVTDSFSNVVSGLGTRRDPSSYTTSNLARQFSEGELESLYVGDGFARRIIDVPAQDMVRAGFCIEVEGDDESQEEAAYAPVMARFEELRVSEHLQEALKLAWLFGGSVIVMGVKDGGDLEAPLNENAVQDIEFLRVYDRFRVSRMSHYDDPADTRYGQTQTYLVSPVRGSPYRVHESRCLVFQGEYVPERMKEGQDGWMASRLAQCWYQLVRLGMAHQWSEKLLERSQQAVNKMQGLGQMLGSPNGQQAVMNRLNVLDMSRNILNTVAVDAQDDYTVTSNTMTGIPEVIDRFAQALSAVTGMPKTLLFGEQSKGLNNGGDADAQLWQGQIQQWQRTKLLHPLDRMVSLMAIALGIPDQNYLIEFEPIHVPSKKEEAETEKLEAEKDKIKADTAAVYITAGALDPSELRNTLLEDSDYKMDGSVTIQAGEDDGAEA